MSRRPTIAVRRRRWAVTPLSHMAAVVVAVVGVAVVAGCSADAESSPTGADAVTSTSPTSSTPGVRVIDIDRAAELHQDLTKGLVVLDVRTPEEFATGHLAGAVMIDFNGPEFEAQIDVLDRDTPYLLYCRSGNRSGQARALMEQLGFVDVADIDGGILAWEQAGLATVTP